MANTASYPIVTPKVTDLIVGTQTFTAADPITDNPTKNFTVASLISLVPGGGGGGLQLGTTSTTALAGNTTTITSAQSIAITANTSKVGYTEAQVSANTSVAANTAKTGITAAQATNITDSVKNNTDTYTGTADVQKVITLSQAEYTAIATPNVNTLYIII